MTSAGAFGIARALDQAGALIADAEQYASALAELGNIELPPAATADREQLRAIASLYLASTLEAAGLIGAAEDLTRMLRTGTLPGNPGDAAPLIDQFWTGRNQRATPDERMALFGRLFGAPAGPVDAAGADNAAFEEALLDLCDAIIKAADGQGQGRVRALAMRLGENLAGAANDMTLMLAREVLDSISSAVAILNHPAIKAMLMARTLWDAVAAIDRKFRRPVRPTLTHLRRGRAGMAVLAWLAEALPGIESGSGPLVQPDTPVVDSAIDWVDETLSIVREEEQAVAASGPPASSGRAAWAELGR